jgi:imidazolonepropionase-like amidohydrolase
MGTDLGFDPEMGSNAAELEIYVNLGMSALEALQTTTINAARALKIANDVGSLKPGKYADILAIDGDPLSDITVLKDKKNIRLVMKGGELYVDRREGRDLSVVVPDEGQWKIVDYL